MNETNPELLMQSTDAEMLRLSAEILEKLTYAVGKDPIVAKPYDWLAATILVVRDRAIDRCMTRYYEDRYGLSDAFLKVPDHAVGRPEPFELVRCAR